MTERDLIRDLYDALDGVLKEVGYPSRYDMITGAALTAAEEYLDTHAYNAEGEEYFD